MSVVGVDCGTSGELQVYNFTGGWIFASLEGTSPASPAFTFYVPSGGVFHFGCDGAYDFDYGSLVPDTDFAYTVFPKSIPFDVGLMGLAGIVCAALITWAFLHH
jgi:hypothetical protein